MRKYVYLFELDSVRKTDADIIAGQKALYDEIHGIIEAIKVCVWLRERSSRDEKIEHPSWHFGL